MNRDRRLEREKETVQKMIILYCQRQSHTENGVLCAECQGLLDYALLRIEKCPFGVDKPTCANCTVHCYQSTMREKIRQVMRYSGPRMLIFHPRLAVLHLMDGLFSKSPQKEEK